MRMKGMKLKELLNFVQGDSLIALCNCWEYWIGTYRANKLDEMPKEYLEQCVIKIMPRTRWYDEDEVEGVLVIEIDD